MGIPLDSTSKSVKPGRWWSLARAGVWAAVVHYLCFLPVLGGVLFGRDYLTRQNYDNFPGFMMDQPLSNDLNAFANWDGVWYADIASKGYTHNPDEGSYVVFFPLYPLLGRAVMKLTGLDAVLSLLMVSHLCLIGSIAVLRRYLAHRFPDWSTAQCDFATVIPLCLPPSMFFRLAYSESLFLLIILLGMYGMERRWRPWIVALLFGAAAGTRAVGAGLSLVAMYYTWQATAVAGRALAIRRIAYTLAVFPLSLWGLLMFMGMLWSQFGDPLLFQTNHAHYDHRTGLPRGEKLWNLVRLEPIWSVYFGQTRNLWTTLEPVKNPLFVQRFMNPINFVVACGLVGAGGVQKLLNRRELLLSLVLLGIPYVTKGHDGAMVGMSRYVSVVFPAWIVLARVVWSCPEYARTIYVAIAVAFLAINSAQFAAWYIYL